MGKKIERNNNHYNNAIHSVISYYQTQFIDLEISMFVRFKWYRFYFITVKKLYRYVKDISIFS